MAAQKMALAPGSKLGSYEVLSQIGAGGMGEVYRARDAQLGRDVAIKVLPASLSRDADRLRRFEQEARAAAALNHPNILAVYQFGTYEGSPYLVSELLEGSTLRDLLLRGPVPIRKAVDYGTQTARGLAAAHEKGIVHRDLKPENLFLTKDGRIKILDFGLAKLVVQPHGSGPGSSDPSSATLTGGTEPGVVLGTAGYMSPEQVRGENTDNRTDFFALGAILYELLTGKRAFHKPTSAETMAAILNEEPPSASQIVPGTPPALQKVVQRCLEKNPVQRFQSASDLAFALEALSDSGSAASGAAPAHFKPRLLWQIFAAGTLFLVVAAAGLLWWTRPPAIPVVETVTQLTSDSTAKTGTLVTDGSRLYFNVGTSGALKLAQVSVSGGATADVPTSLPNPQIAGLSGDGATLLLAVGGYLSQSSQLWIVPLPAGEPRRLGEPNVLDASIFPDGRLLYLTNSGTYIAEKDGANPRKIDALSKLKFAPNISPDGKRIIYSNHGKNGVNSISVAASDGSAAHEILRGGTQGLLRWICCPAWSANQEYVIFAGSDTSQIDIWAIRDHKSILEPAPEPVRLTNGQLSYSSIAPGRDPKQIFAIAQQRFGELVRYDTRLNEFVPFLGGISAIDPTFSRDGQWVSYLSYPDGTVWRSRADGSERVQLTHPPAFANFARISPDGGRVAFSDSSGTCFLVDASDGKIRKLSDRAAAPDWSPDGNLLAVTSPSSASSKDLYYFERIIDVRTGQITDIPDSRGMIGPWFVSQDVMIAALQDQSKFVAYSFKTQKWSNIISHPGQFMTWEVSSDLKYFFYATGGNDPRVFRMRISDHAVEEIASLKNFAMTDWPALSASPDNSPVFTRNAGTHQVYAISVKWP